MEHERVDTEKQDCYEQQSPGASTPELVSVHNLFRLVAVTVIRSVWGNRKNKIQLAHAHSTALDDLHARFV